MKAFLYAIVELIAEIHSYLLRLNDAYEYNFSDKELHFLIIGALGMAMIFAVHPVFKWLAKNNHIMVISWTYVFTLIIVITFAIEIGQRVTNTGEMEFADIMFGVLGFISMFLVFSVFRGIYHVIVRFIKDRYGDGSDEEDEDDEEDDEEYPERGRYSDREGGGYQKGGQYEDWDEGYGGRRRRGIAEEAGGGYRGGRGSQGGSAGGYRGSGREERGTGTSGYRGSGRQERGTETSGYRGSGRQGEGAGFGGYRGRPGLPGRDSARETNAMTHRKRESENL